MTLDKIPSHNTHQKLTTHDFVTHFDIQAWELARYHSPPASAKFYLSSTTN
jgi:hypothetical protein